MIEICPACGAGRAYHRTLSVIDRYTLPARFDYCRKCAFVFANPRLTPKAYARFYQDGHYRRMVTECTGADQSIESINQSQRFYATWIGHQFGDQIGIGLSGGGRLLDAGGGTGVFAKTLVEAFGGASGTVVDPAEAEVMHAQRLGLRAIPASVEDWEPDGQYEVTAIVQTIDHLLDPLPVLRKLRQVTSRLLLIDIVDFPRLWSAHWQRFAHGAGALKIDHPSNFHPAGIEALLARSGFRVLKKAPRPGKAAVALAAEPVAEVYQDARPGTGHVHGIIRGCFESHTWLGRYHMQPQ